METTSKALRFGPGRGPGQAREPPAQALGDGQAGGLITASVARYYDIDRLKELEEQEQEITEKFQKKFGRFITKWT